MLNLVNPEEFEGSEVLNLVREFRRVQVSRFPINVEFSPEGNAGAVRFMDSRFSSRHSLGRLHAETDDKGDYVWVLTSRLINNERFVRGNDRKHQKQTKDPKKVLRYLRDYIRPYSAKEIADRSVDVHVNALDTWKSQAMSLMRDLCNLTREDVMREMVRMSAVGYKPQTEKFAQVMEQGLAAWEEAQRRSNRKVMNVHLFINPDESVEIFCQDKMGYMGINQGVTTFTSLAETPECIQQHVAMLRMMEDKAFVPEVGTKVNASNYWIEVHSE